MKRSVEDLKEELNNPNVLVKRVLGYSREQWEIMQNPEWMTLQLFDECISTSIWIEDFEIYEILKELFPRYYNVLLDQAEEEYKKAKKSQCTPEEIKAGLEKLMKDIEERYKEESANEWYGEDTVEEQHGEDAIE